MIMKAATGWMLTLATASAMLVSPLHAQQFAYPAKGQSAEQQQKDEAECGKWATGQTGYDPASPPPQTAAPKPPTTATGTVPGAGVRGAARGAVVGEVVGGDAGTGAAVGAASARAQSRRQNQAQQQQAAASQQQALASANATWAQARGACLQGKGYTVK
jgi:hypothetical protein